MRKLKLIIDKTLLRIAANTAFQIAAKIKIRPIIQGVSNMAISSEKRKTSLFIGDGDTSVFPFDFRVFAETDIAVYVADLLGNETAYTLGRDYNVKLNDNQAAGGKVTLTVPLPTGHKLALLSNIPYLQEIEFTNLGGFHPTVLNLGLDKVVAQIQQIKEISDRSLKASVTADRQLSLPSPAAGKSIGWDDKGELVNTDHMERAEAAAAAAQEIVDKAADKIADATDKRIGTALTVIEQSTRQAAASAQQALSAAAQAIAAASGGVAVLPSAAALKAHTGKAGDTAVMLSYHDGKNLGGGVFIAEDSSAEEDGGTILIAANGIRWRRIIQGNTLTLEDFGALPDGITECGAAINRAFAACAGKYDLKASAGLYLTAQELKAPSGLWFAGAGMYATEIKAHPQLPTIANLITNASNNYQNRTTFDRDIDISDITFNHEWRGRYQIGNGINNQACAVKFSAVKSSSLTNVRAINAALHCFDICADQYLDTGNVADNAANQSEQIYLRGCVAENPYRDDGFTTHNSRNIVFENCVAVFDGSVSTLGNTQQGFEADEGSSGVTFRNCTARGFHCGFQSKGHRTTKPAEQIKFSDCLAENCAIGFMASTGYNPTGTAGYYPQGVSFENCAARNLAANPHLPLPIALWIYGADSVRVDTFHNHSMANIVIEQGAGYVTLEHVVFTALLPETFPACIEMRSTLSGANKTTIAAYSSEIPQKIPALLKDNANALLEITGFDAPGAGGSHAIGIRRNPRDRVFNIRCSGYNGTGANVSAYLIDENIYIQGDCTMDVYNKIYMYGNAGAGIKAPRNTVITNAIGSQWIQKNPDGNAPNWKLVIDAT